MALRIVVCGDEAVGKSSLIATLVKDKFVSKIQGKLPPVSISRKDYAMTNEMGTNTQNSENDRKGTRSIPAGIPHSIVVIDTVASDEVSLNTELKKADVIMLLYSDHYTYERVSLFWMPFFRSSGVNLPIIVCASKFDLITKSPGKKNSSYKQSNREEFCPLINDYKEIEACIRCSAKLKDNVVEAFYLCQRAVTHPISPIFDSKEGSLKPAAIKALQRVFFLCDADIDGYLNYKEFSDLHLRCFEKTLSKGHFDDIVAALSEKILPDSDDQGNIKGISENGFIFLNKIYAENGRHESIWGILRAFNYTDSLSLNDKFLYPKVEVAPNSSVELSPEGYRFLVDLFLKFDKDNDGGLNDEEMKSLFLPTPGVPKLWKETNFPSSIVCNEEGYVSLQGWLAQWNLTTFLDHKTTLEYLAYLGFDDGNSLKAIKVTKPRRLRQKQGKQYRGVVNDRNVFHCFVLGAPKSGKTSLLESFIRGSYSDAYSPTIKPKVCVKDIELRGGKQCYLILEELGELEPAILENQKRLDQCDAICYAYDSSDPESFQYIVNLREKHSKMLNDIPSVFAAFKADLDKQQQRSDVQPENYIRDLFLGSPLHISSSWPMSIHELFIQLVDAAKMPSTATPGLDPHPDTADMERIKHIFIAGGVVTVMTIVSIWIFRSAQRSGRG